MGVDRRNARIIMILQDGTLSCLTCNMSMVEKPLTIHWMIRQNSSCLLIYPIVVRRVAFHFPDQYAGQIIRVKILKPAE